MEPTITSQPADHRNAARLGNFTSAHLGKFEPALTTVQPKAITFPTDAKLLHAAIKGLNRLATRHGVRLRQSYSRVAKAAAMMAGRYAHAKQFKRHQRQVRILRSRLGRIIRDIRRKIEGQAALEEMFAIWS
jgi:transposase, IS5 family